MQRSRNAARESVRERVQGAVPVTLTVMWRTRGGAAAFMAAFLAAAPALAHPVPFSYVDIHLQPAAVEVSVVVHVIDVAHDLGVAPPERLLDQTTLDRHAGAVTSLVRSRLRLASSGTPLTAGIWSRPVPVPERQSLQLRARYDLSSPVGVLSVTASLFPYDPRHRTFLNVYEESAIKSQAILDRGDAGFEYFAGTRQGVGAVISRFLPEGIHHILIGPDHILFLVGLLLLGGSLSRLLLIVSAFTAGHSITLSLATLSILSPPSRLIEPAIALSIVYVGADNLLVRSGRDARAWIALGFGLIHGFGFAGVLREIGLPGSAFGWSLLSFNVGVEIGQLFVVLVVASALAWLRRHSETAGRRLALAGSILVIVAGSFWFVQRVFFTGGMG